MIEGAPAGLGGVEDLDAGAQAAEPLAADVGQQLPQDQMQLLAGQDDFAETVGAVRQSPIDLAAQRVVGAPLETLLDEPLQQVEVAPQLRSRGPLVEPLAELARRLGGVTHRGCRNRSTAEERAALLVIRRTLTDFVRWPLGGLESQPDRQRYPITA